MMQILGSVAVCTDVTYIAVSSNLSNEPEPSLMDSIVVKLCTVYKHEIDSL